MEVLDQTLRSVPELGLAFFYGCRDSAPKEETLGWDAFVEKLSRRDVRPSKDGLAFSPARFRAGGKRRNKDVLAVCALVADLDGTDFEEYRAVFESKMYACLAHTTHSHEPGKPRWRVVVPLDRPVSAADWGAFYTAACQYLFGDAWDKSCSDPARLHYLPSCPPGRKMCARVVVLHGEPFEVSSVLRAAPASRGCIERLRSGEVADGEKHSALRDAVRAMRGAGWAMDRAKSEVRRVLTLWDREGRLGEPLDRELEVWERDVERVWRRFEPDVRSDVPDRAGPYVRNDGMLWRAKQSADGAQLVPLTNFDCRIVSESFRDDGQECSMVLGIEGACGGDRLPRAYVGKAELQAGRLPDSWGLKPMYMVGPSVKEHAFHAIVELSGEIPRETIYTHTGWRNIDGRDVFLHAGGAIGKDGPVAGIETDLADSLGRYSLPPPSEGRQLLEDLRAVLRFLDAAPSRVSGPLFAAALRAVLGGSDVTLWLFGPTQSQKSSLAAALLNLFGTGFERNRLPATWNGTANSIEGLGYVAKDLPLVVDDAVPRGSRQDVLRLDGTIQRVLRSVGNSAGRSRMRADGSLRSVKALRCGLICTGEDLPRGESETARCLVVEVSRGEVELDVMSEVQRFGAEGRLARAMAAYLKWLARDLDGMKHRFRERIASARTGLRTAENAAQLEAAAELFAAFALECGLPEDEASEALGAIVGGVREAASRQERYQRDHNAADRFLAILLELRETGQARLETVSAPPGENLAGTMVGWARDCDAFLLPEIAYKMVAEFAEKSGQPLGASKTGLWKMLSERGVLIRQVSQSGYASKQRIGHRVRSVIHLKDVLADDDFFGNSGNGEVDEATQ